MTRMFPPSSLCPQLHMGKQAEEQQKYGERVCTAQTCHTSSPFVTISFLELVFLFFCPTVGLFAELSGQTQ